MEYLKGQQRILDAAYRQYCFVRNRFKEMKTSSAIVGATAGLACSSAMNRRLDDGLGRTPAMGWSSWNVAKCDAATEEYALDTANKFIELGLKDLGYTYVNIDDCWLLHDRDNSSNLVPDPAKWPNGISSVTDKLHEQGLKFGLYGCSGIKTCGGYPGSKGHEEQDARLLASWGVDFWKYDNCWTPCKKLPIEKSCHDPDGYTWEWYRPMRDAIIGVKDTHEIMFNLCQWGRDDVWTWAADYGHSWRMSQDNWGDWGSVVRIGSAAADIADYAAPGGFNDMDMLIVGNGKLTEAEERLHFGLWAICKSPLILGTDLNQISESTLDIVKNKGIIGINQDRLGKAAKPFRPSEAPAPVGGQIYEYWAGELSDGVVIGLCTANGAARLSVNFADVPGLGYGVYRWKEMYSGEMGLGFSAAFDLGEHDMAVIKVYTD